ncbi:flippase [Haloferax sp. Atlit-48N]|uniref:Flippase n=1 Tax=Haloferax sp. Atlit-48N TaxID=2077198 RepID=A0ACD5HVJ4_9EURY|nr:flippase [Haloferax sp. Atlit-48N]RDZ31160.1 hypothetical protein DEQ67_07085 [Haloferax sp. Atlit-48N]
MKDIGNLAKSVSLVFIGTILGQALGLLGELIIIRSVAPDVLGRLGLAYAVVSTLGTIVLFGVPSGVTRYLSTGDSQNRTGILPSGYAITLSSSSILALLLFTFRSEISSIAGNTNIGSVLVFFLPYLLVLPIARISFAGLRADHRTKAAVVSKWVGPRIVALPLLIVAIYLGQNEIGVILYWVIIPATASILSLWFLRTSFKLSKISTPTQEEVRELWRYSWPLAVSVSLTILLTRLDILMLSLFVDSTSIGYYRSIQPLRQVTTLVSASFGFLFLPLATKYYESDNIVQLDKLYSTSTKWISTLTFPFILVFALFSNDVIRVFFGVEYTPASLTLSILVGGLFFRSLVGLDTDLLKAINRTKIELVCAVIGVMSNIILNYMLIPRFGIEGAALATIGGFFTYNLAEVLIIYSMIGIHPFKMNNLKPLIPSLVFAVLMQQSLTNNQLNIFYLIFIGMSYTLIQLLALVFTNSLDESDLLLIQKFESRIGYKIPIIRSFIN